MSQDHEHQPQGSEYTGQLDQWQPVAREQGDATGGVIPYKSGPALAAYYLGIFSLLPCAGLLLAIPALIFGIIGLKRRRENPVVKGSVHAWIGIIMGGLFTIIWGGLIIYFVVGTYITTVKF